MKIDDLKYIAEKFKNTQKMPVLFIGHGSPMNAIEDNEFTKNWNLIGKSIQRPNAIVCISAHWETNGTQITAMENPKTIHDFGGFPKELFDVEYPAKGNQKLAEEIKNTAAPTEIILDYNWGLDHGAWSILKHLYPNANIPVIQLSLDYKKTSNSHYEFAKNLNFLRHKGILVIGSGNLVHNLKMIKWDKLNESEYGYEWANEISLIFKTNIINGNHKALIDYNNLSRYSNLAIPTPEHYLPLLYTLALQDRNDSISFFNDKAIGGSLTMTSLLIN